jgi:RHS repeat-associated protein
MRLFCVLLLAVIPSICFAKINCDLPVSYPSNHGRYVSGQRFNIEVACSSDLANASLHYKWSTPLPKTDSPSIQFILTSSANVTLTVSEQLECAGRDCAGDEITLAAIPFHVGSTCHIGKDQISGQSVLQCPGVPVQADGQANNTSGCPTNPNPPARSCSNPVNTASGSMWHEQVDFVVKGRTATTDLTLRRLYTANAAGTAGGFGPNWNFGYETNLLKYVDPSTSRTDLIWIDESGGPYTFLGQADGSFSSPPGLQISISADITGTNPLGLVYILSKKDHTRYYFSAASSILNGKILQITDPHGESISFSYDSSGRLSSVSAPFAGQIAFTYNGANLISSVTRVRDNLTYSYFYQGDHKLKMVQDPQGRNYFFTYVSGSPNSLAQGKLETITDPIGRVLRFSYDSQGRALQQFEPGGGTWSFSYGDHQTQVSMPNGFSETYFFDANYKEVRHEFADGSIFNTSWNAQGFRSQSGYDLLGTTQFGYDSNGNVNSIQRPLDPTPTRIQYDQSFNKPVSFIPLAGAPFTFTLDQASGDLLGISRTGGGTTLSISFTRDQFGNLLSSNNGLMIYADQRNASGFLTRKFDTHNPVNLTYDSRGRPTLATWTSGRAQGYFYNDDDQIVRITETNLPAIIFEYDQMKRLVQRVVQADIIQQTTYSYDSRDRIVQITNALGQSRLFFYDSAHVRNLPSEVKDEAGYSTFFTYDKLDRILTRTDPRGAVTSYSHDSKGRVTSVTDPLRNVTRYSYDLNDRLISESRPSSAFANNQTAAVTFTQNKFYDLGDHLLRSEKVSPTGGATQAVVFAYDDFDRIISKSLVSQGTIDTVQDVATYSYSPQLDSNLITQAQNWNAVEAFSYDNAPPFSNLHFSVSPSSRIDAPHILAGDYSASIGPTGQVTQLQDGSGNIIINKIYDQSGRITHASAPGGVATDIYYDGSGRPFQWVHSTGQRETVLYDALNRKTSLSWFGGLVGQESLSYNQGGDVSRVSRENGFLIDLGYDSTHQITDISGSETKSFRYDGAGNRTFDSLQGNSAFVANFLTDNLSSHYIADPDGFGLTVEEITGTKIKGYQYRADGLVTSFRDSTTSVTYAYDAFGRRVAKTFTSGNPPVAFDHAYSYLGLDHKILQAKGADGSITTFVDGDGIDEHLSEVKNGIGKGYVVDHLGSVLNGNVSGSSSSFDVFGEPSTLPVFSIATNPVNYGFTGREFDVESGANYHRARLYSPSNGRWLSQDGIGQLSGDSNFYRYALNRPAGLTDPNGNCPWCLGAAIGAVAGGIGGYITSGGKLGPTLAGIAAGAAVGLIAPQYAEAAGASAAATFAANIPGAAVAGIGGNVVGQLIANKIETGDTFDSFSTTQAAAAGVGSIAALGVAAGTAAAFTSATIGALVEGSVAGVVSGTTELGINAAFNACPQK